MSFISQGFNQNSLSYKKQDSRAIAFIDSQLSDSDRLIQKVVKNARVIVIGSEDNGIQEISKILHYSNCLEIHIFSTGTPGCIYLGDSELSIDTLSTYNLDLKNWFNNRSLAAPKTVTIPYIWLYGCNLAAGDVGEEFINKLSQITQAKITASVNTSGSPILKQI